LARQFGLAVHGVDPIPRHIELASKALAIPVEPNWGSMSARIWDTAVWVADNRRTREVLGWTPRTSLAEGFSLTVEWFRQHASLLPGEKG
jgi:nucleoside-diphosphate-sugar epimerase